MKSKVVIFCCLLVVSLYGCSSGKQDDKDFLDAEIRTVESRQYEEELFISFCGDMAITNSHFILTHDGGGWGTSVFRESDGKKVGSIGSTGQGPGEYITPSYAGKSASGDTIYIYDVSTQAMLMYKIDNFGDNFEWHYIDKIAQTSSRMVFYRQLRRLNNGYYVGLRMETIVGLRMETEAEPRQEVMTLLDAQLNEVTTFGTSPITLGKNDDRVYSNTRMSVYENSVFFAVNRFGYVAGYDISDQGEVTTRFEKMLVEPSYHRNAEGRVAFNSENKMGFSDIAVSENYLFAIYRGKTQDQLRPDGTGWEPETFAVFSNDGTLISRIKLNHTATRLTVSEDEERLYFCTRDLEFRIEEYKVSDLIR